MVKNMNMVGGPLWRGPWARAPLLNPALLRTVISQFSNLLINANTACNLLESCLKVDMWSEQ